MEKITITVTLTQEEAQAYAQFLKRAGYDTYRINASGMNEAYTMQDAGERVRAALAKVGYAPR